VQSLEVGFRITEFGRVWQPSSGILSSPGWSGVFMTDVSSKVVLNYRLLPRLFKVGIRFTRLSRVCVGGLFDPINSVGFTIIDEASRRLLLTRAVGSSIR
jgi:hypothetical protein